MPPSPASSTKKAKTPDPCILVIFGATGDLTSRKLMPALYNLSKELQLPQEFACVGFARREKTHEMFRKEMQEAVTQFSRSKPLNEAVWHDFSERIFYHISEFDDDEGYSNLNKLCHDLDKKFGTRGNRIFYLSTQPSFFPVIVEKLHQHRLIYRSEEEGGPWSRVVIEKPFGRDYPSAVQLQHHIEHHLHESQVYRIDHYLGKETVQNLLVFRFANSIFESLWNSQHIEHVQITVGEEIGIGSRGRFFEEAGMLRDIVQNHMMQLLSLVAMEPPVNLQADSIRNEKVKVLESIRPIRDEDFDLHVVRGQYGPGHIEQTAVKGYREEDNVAKDSSVETFVALELFIDNWRWAGVPFYLRAGKRLPKRTSEIIITFKEVPGVLFSDLLQDKKSDTNVLIIRIQPNEGISLNVNCKVPGSGSPIRPVKMDFHYGTYFGQSSPEAYEKLILDCILGDSTLFARSDEVLASWRLLTPILERWAKEPAEDLPNYAAGSWGPEAANDMLAREGRAWKDL